MTRRVPRIYVSLCIFLPTFAYITWLSAKNDNSVDDCATESAMSPMTVKRSIGINESFIFIGGVPRSGTTLMRAMLDAHGDIRCGEETHVIPDILELREQWNQSAAAEILKLAGVTEAVLRKAIGAFMIEVIINHGPKARRFCDKDPLSLLWMEYIHEIFPNSKFILLLRDGRATVHSIITRQIPVARFDTTRPEDCLREWNRLIELMFSQCERLGRSACFPVHYERLVLDSRTEMRKILQFIEVEWSEDVLHHEKFVEKYVKLSPGEYSSSQVRMPIHREALSNWFDFYSFDVRSRMHQLAPMLAKLGYNPYDNRPNYTDLLYKHSLRDRK